MGNVKLDIILHKENWFDFPISDLPYGWAGAYTNPNNIGFDKHFQLYNDIVDWILNNVSDPVKNARWVKLGDCIYVYIRKRKDLTLFLLRWS